MTSRFTMNLGIQYDYVFNVCATHIVLPTIISAERPNDTNNFQPRLGFAYTLTDRTVIRGGYGRYYGDIITGLAGQMNSLPNTAVVEILNDGRPDLAENPFNSRWPTSEQRP